MFSTYRLPGKLSGEKVVKVIRRDFFVLVKKVLFFSLLILLPLFFFYVVSTSIFPNLLNGPISYPAFILGASAYYVFVWLLFFFSFLDYFLDVWVITDERIIDIQQKGFFSRVISEQRLYRIQDVTSEVHGFWATMFKFGDVHVQTAGAKQRFFFQEIPHPDETRDLIIKLSERSKRIHKIDS